MDHCFSDLVMNIIQFADLQNSYQLDGSKRQHKFPDKYMHLRVLVSRVSFVDIYLCSVAVDEWRQLLCDDFWLMP